MHHGADLGSTSGKAGRIAVRSIAHGQSVVDQELSIAPVTEVQTELGIAQVPAEPDREVDERLGSRCVH